MFGGSGWGNKLRGVMSDLWTFELPAERWVFKGGQPGGVELNGTCGPRGVAGTTFLPTARHAGYNFDLVADGRMFVYGGEHDHEVDIFDDLWTVSLGSGPSLAATSAATVTAAQPTFAFQGVDCNVPNVLQAHRGTQGIASPENSPQSRFGGNGWVDEVGRAWIFGGGREGYTNDLWYWQQHQ